MVQKVTGTGVEGGGKEMLHAVPFPPSQLEELKQQLELQEEELGRLRLGVVRLRGGAPGSRMVTREVASTFR